VSCSPLSCCGLRGRGYRRTQRRPRGQRGGVYNYRTFGRQTQPFREERKKGMGKQKEIEYTNESLKETLPGKRPGKGGGFTDKSAARRERGGKKN